MNLTSYSGLALIGQCCEAAQVEAVIDPRLPVSQGMKTSDMVKAMTGLLSLGKSDFEAIEPFRTDRFFKEALGLSKAPSSAWMRQRLDAKARELKGLTDELSVRLLAHTEAPITPYKGYVRFEIDTFVMKTAENGAAGDHVPGGEVRGACQTAGARLWPQRHRSRQGVRCAASALVARGLAMTTAPLSFPAAIPGSAQAEGSGSSWSRKMT